MKFRTLLLEYIENEMNEINIEELFHSVLERDIIKKEYLTRYVEASYYKNILSDGGDKELLGLFYQILIMDEEPTKLNFLYIMTRTDEVNKKSLNNIYI